MDLHKLDNLSNNEIMVVHQKILVLTDLREKDCTFCKSRG